MLKVAEPNAWDFDEPVAQAVKVSSRGLRGRDRRDFLKRAAPQFERLVDRLRLAPDEQPVHFVIVGSTEYYGPNRNGDGFKEAACRKYAATFVKHARYYRNHRNKDPRRSYGRVLAAVYNEPMHRIELLVGLNGSEKTAQVNGGLVADYELEKLANGEEIAVSMACKVPYDVCSGCGNRARTRAEYCTEETCRYGGLKRHITKVAADGHILHADNPICRFIDISTVFRPADRIAYSLGPLGAVDWQKRASGPMGGAELAELYRLEEPTEVLLEDLPETAREELRILDHMQGLESRSLLAPEEAGALAPGGSLPGPPPVKSAADVRTLVRELAEAGALLSLEDFLRLSGVESEKVAETCRELLPGLYGRLRRAGDLEHLLATNPYRPEPGLAHRALGVWAEKVAALRPLDPERARRRVIRRALAEPTWQLKVAAGPVQEVPDDRWAEERLLQRYALYKLATLAWRKRQGIGDWRRDCRLALAQDYVN